MKAKKIECYACPQCGSLYEDEFDAQECCTDSIDPQDGWLCLVCGEIYDNKEEAKNCCKKDNTESVNF